MKERQIIKDRQPDLMNKLARLWTMVGNTPMLGIRYKYKDKIRTVYAKCEHYNLTGSIKDRMALYILQRAYAEGKIQPGDRIVEASSGLLRGSHLLRSESALNHPVTIIMPDWLSQERIDIIKSLGAEIILISKEEGGFLGSIERTLDMAVSNTNIFLPMQFENVCNAEAHTRKQRRPKSGRNFSPSDSGPMHLLPAWEPAAR